MTSNDKLERHYNNLDNAYDLLLEEREKEAYQDEIIRDWVLTDLTLFDRLAREWLDDPTNREEFLYFAVEKVKRERTPKYTRAWGKDPLGEVI